MMNTESSSSDNAIRFPSLESLRAAHTELLKRFRLDGSGSEMIADAETFIRRGKATGALLDMDADRWVAQSQLDYWATQLYKPDYEPPDATLDDFDPRIAPELDDSLCPYLGLDSFHEAHQSIFFGRGRLAAELVHKLKATRFLAVLGSSGSGKSSMVRAGLIPALKKASDSKDTGWMYVAPMVPGSNPLANLVRLMMPDAGPAQAHAEVILLQQTPVRLSQLVSEKSDRNVVLVVDQFEEVFTLCTDEETRHAFVDNLIRLAQREDRQDRVIITMRTDFESNIARLPELQPIFEQAVVRITPLNASELREAIEAPAARIGLKFEEGVVDSLLNDTLGEPAALPLLQFTLLKLWQNRERNRITWESYRKLGGGRQALARSADEFYNRLIPEEQVTMRRILLKMVRPGEGLEVTSNRVPRVALYQKAEANDRIDRVLDKLIQSRLVRVSEGDVAADEQVEIAHEALVRNWPRLVEWLEEERVTLRQRQRLTTAAEEWQRLEHEDSLLWRGILLDEARHYDDLSQLETEFVEAGYAAEQAETRRKLDEAQRQKELEYTKKLAETEKLRAEEQARSATGLRRRSLFLTVALAVALFAVVAAVFYALQAQTATAYARTNAAEAQKQASLAQANAEEAQRQTKMARVGQLTAQSAFLRDKQLDVSFLLGIEAFQRFDNGQTRDLLLDNLQSSQLIQFLRGDTAKVWTVAFSSDGKTIASGDDDGTVILWDAMTHQPMGQPLSVAARTPVLNIAFSPDGKILASGNGDATITLLDVTTRKLIGKPLRGHTDGVNGVAFSPDGKVLASASSDNKIILWDVASRQPIGQPLLGHTDDVWSVSFSPDGKTLASGSSDRTVMLWNVPTGQPIGQPLRGHTNMVFSVAFSPKGDILASGGQDSTIILWDLSTGQAIGQPLSNGIEAVVTSLAFSPNGKILASAGYRQTLRLWDVTSRQPIGQLRGHMDSVQGVAFSPDGKTLVSGSLDKTVILWDIVGNRSVSTQLYGHTEWVSSVTFSPDGKIMASASWDGTIILRDSASFKPIGQPLTGHTAAVRCIAFSPDGKTLISGSEDRTLILWDVATHQPIGQPFRGHTAPVRGVAFSPDGKMLVSGSEDETLILWDVASHQPLGQPLRSHTGWVESVAFSPDGKIIVSGSNKLVLWDATSHRLMGKPLEGHTDSIQSVAFSPDGKLLASGGADQTVMLWDVTTGLPVGQPLRGHTDWVMSVAFSPDGKTLASGSADKTILLWDVATGLPMSPPLQGHTDVVWNVAFNPSGKVLASASADKTIMLWDMDPQSWINRSCQRVGRNFTREEWKQYFPGEAYHSTCPQ